MIKPAPTAAGTTTTALPLKSAPGWVSKLGQKFLVYCTVCLTVYGALRILALGSIEVRSELVFWSAWITMATTGLGVLPFVFVREMNPHWTAGMNCVAAGMMLSASVGLVEEGVMEDYPGALSRVGLGLALGVGFIFLAKQILDGQEEVSLMELRGLDAKRAFLIMTVMTLHSLSEGVGIGVSYNNRALGGFISLTMAVHNIPEGVAIALVMIPRGVSKTTCALYCFLSSLPQPIMAVPAFLFVEAFRPVFGVGLGFAAGAMGHVAVFELLHEALETLSTFEALSVTTMSALGMVLLQLVLK